MSISEQKRKFQKIAFLSDVINILLSLIAIPVSLVLFYNFKNGDFTYLQSIGFNWKSYPINSISELSFQYGKCKGNETQIIFDFWAGTTKGCDCTSNILAIGSGLTRGFCSRRQSGCVSIPANSASPYLFWRNKMFCKYQNTINYFDLKIAENPEDCPNGYKNCGIIDSKFNFICIENNQSCPINQIKFFSYSDLKPNNNSNFLNNNLLKNYISYIEVDNGIIAYSNLFSQNKVLTQFKISEGKPCIIPYFENARSNKFILENTFYLSKCYTSKLNTTESYDENYNIIDSYKKLNLFSQNGILNNFKYFINKTSTLQNDAPQFENIIETYSTTSSKANQITYTINPVTSESSTIDVSLNLAQNTPINYGNYYANYIYKYDFNYNYNIDLFYRNYIGLKKSCFNDIQTKGLKDLMMTHVATAPIYFAIASDICYYLIIFIFTLATYNIVVYGTFYILKYSIDQIDVVYYFDMLKYKILISVFPLLMSIIFNALIGYIRSILNFDRTALNYLNNSDCLDIHSYSILNDFYQRVDKGLGLAFGAGSIIGISMLNTVAFYALRFFKVLKED